ncbi:unnamed protein product [Rotaria magnacalcarata]|uniref:Uncharacterized protein n=1 Tax=Rotaria magnacalcarata TaxID=392030 RepID=A0A816VC15_9BILA|nr:unnamed protein product [Rotaria magnacalcarata]CAF4077472.1 unnamed protein product [Rotaria magnacalcarata]
MLKSVSHPIRKKDNIRTKSVEHNKFNSMIKRDQHYEDVRKVKYPFGKIVLNMQHVTRKDMNQMKTNKIYERRMDQDLTGPRGLNCRYKQELQRLRSNERDVELDLIRLNRDLFKTISSSMSQKSSLVGQSKESTRKNKPRLSSITEENSSTQFAEKSKQYLGCLSSLSQSETARNSTIAIQERSATHKINSMHKHNHWLCKYSFQRDIVKTSDDYMYLQKRAHLVNQQKQLFNQKLKKFLN